MSGSERADEQAHAQDSSGGDDSDHASRDGTHGERNSVDIGRRDRRIIDEEEEVEQLLTGGKPRSNLKAVFQRTDREDEQRNEVRVSDRERRQHKREAKRQGRKSRRRRRKGEESELMYEMEEGGHRDSGESSGNSSEMDRQKLEELRPSRHTKGVRLGRVAGIHVLILAVICAMLFGAYMASRHKPRPQSNILMTLNNGTSTFAPTTILISLDGFRADFLQRGLTPALNGLIQAGVSPLYMLPSFPSVTFPNHFTLVTGLYPESHGIVGNTFWDPTMQAEFYYTDPARSLQPKWWQGEPIWETAEHQRVRTAIHMWPGSEAHIGNVEPTYVDKYNGEELLSNKVNRILGLLDLPGPDDPAALANYPRPQLIAAYVPNVDADGHLYGPNSTEIRATIHDVDSMLGDLLQGLHDRNLTDIVNVVVVSDHGMATTSITRLIQLEDLINTSAIEHTDGWPLYGLRPTNDGDLDSLYQHLRNEARNSGHFDVYLRDLDMPERYHFSANERIAPLWIVPKTGWAIVTKDEFDVEAGKAQGLVYHPRGLHGYDHEHPLMRAIFIAKGPAFPHTPNSRLDIFQNTEVYNIVCDSLGIEPRPNNGTLRLPLIPVGLHDAPADVPDDLPNDTDDKEEAPIENAGAFEPKVSEPAETTDGNNVPDTDIARPIIHDGLDEHDDDESGKGKDINMWWDWIHGKMDGIKNWATGLVKSTKPGVPTG